MKLLQKEREEHAFKNVWTQDGRIMYWDAVSDGTMRCLKQKGKIVLAFVSFYFHFVLVVCF